MMRTSECISQFTPCDVKAEFDTECPSFCPIALTIETDASIVLQMDECHAQKIVDALNGALAQLHGQRFAEGLSRDELREKLTVDLT